MAVHDASKSEDTVPTSPSSPVNHSVAGHTESAAALDESPPTHPVPALQRAFEESILDSATPDQEQDQKSDLGGLDAETRRRNLLQAKCYDEVRAAGWGQNKDARYHPFLKLVSQIVFGMHLLQQQQAISNEEVVKILQTHVNEVDSFLERTADDFDLALMDIEERIRYLKLPMQHMNVFEAMLDEKKFRTDLLLGNDKIEKIIRRTSQAMNDAVFDVQNAIDSTKELGLYLNNIETGWPTQDEEIGDVFTAMRGNEQGWTKFLQDLRAKGGNLASDLEVLRSVVAEISRLAGAASRRNKSQSHLVSPAEAQSPRRTSSSQVRSRFARDRIRQSGLKLDKPLPKEPGISSNAILVKTHPVPLSTRYERPREVTPTPSPKIVEKSIQDRPKLSAEAAAVQSADVHGFPKDIARQVATLPQNCAPLRSHPPDDSMDQDSGLPSRMPGRSQSQGAVELLKPRSRERPPTDYRRSRSQGDLSQMKEPRRSRSLPRKTVTSTAKRSETVIKYVPQVIVKSAGASNKADSSRRPSAKLLSPRVQSSPKREPDVEQISSGHLSGVTKDHTRLSADGATDTEKAASTQSPRDLTALSQQQRTTDGPRLRLFPHDSGPLSPAQATQQTRDLSPMYSGWGPAGETRPQQMPPSHLAKPSRRISIRNFFHRKGESTSIMAPGLVPGGY